MRRPCFGCGSCFAEAPSRGRLVFLLVKEVGRDDDAALELHFKSIGLKFKQLYWQQAAPYAGQKVLVQNLGSQAAVIKAIAEYRRRYPAPSFHTAQGATELKKLLNTVTATVKAQPIQYIQNLGGAKNVFLFEVGKQGVTLLPGVAFCHVFLAREASPVENPALQAP